MSKDYEVGRGKPPKHTQYPKGQSGNPKGRPKGTKNFKTDVQSTLAAKIKVTKNGKPKNVSTQEAMLLRLREKALKGDARALDRLLGLAQAYNSEELTLEAADALGPSDNAIIENFLARKSDEASVEEAAEVDELSLDDLPIDDDPRFQ